MGVDRKYMSVNGCKPFVICALKLGRLLYQLPDIVAAEALMKMHSFDISQEVSVGVEHLMHIADGFLLRLQRRIRMKKMPRIQHNPFVFIIYAVKRQTRHVGAGHIEARPPKIFNKKTKWVSPLSENSVNKLQRSFDDLLVAM